VVKDHRHPKPRSWENPGELRYGWQAAMVRTLFGQNANRGGWNRQKAIDVAAYWRSHPRASCQLSAPLTAF
jgi:hypothetical protein